ncbi:hypothetical protein B0T17DRAFT_402990 [Bombardia bombarda]|uniref:Uncharacterized protein n=1 Tax=Bombardia bombarda TaxID=252184 RepID=A0AA39U5Q9_9PEZI|nr:hypothetical protein B0T17DRAFT_402990 [Bombardia bombarda]
MYHVYRQIPATTDDTHAADGTDHSLSCLNGLLVSWPMQAWSEGETQNEGKREKCGYFGELGRLEVACPVAINQRLHEVCGKARTQEKTLSGRLVPNGALCNHDHRQANDRQWEIEAGPIHRPFETQWGREGGVDKKKKETKHGRFPYCRHSNITLHGCPHPFGISLAYTLYIFHGNWVHRLVIHVLLDELIRSAKTKQVLRSIFELTVAIVEDFSFQG